MAVRLPVKGAARPAADTGEIPLSPVRALVLASGSRYRRELLARVLRQFEWESPDIDETAHRGESGVDLVIRLAHEKAHAVAARHPEALIIGSDQVALLGETILTKPGNATVARAQLAACSGRTVTFVTGLCLLDAASRREQQALERFTVQFRRLTASEIATYIEKEQPFDCAGSFRAEGLGIALFERLEGDDPNTLIGLPLIRLLQMLRAEGVDPLKPG